jgi:toxin FitB
VNVVDSSAWLEYLGDGPNADEFAPAIESPADLVVPTLTLFEVFKRVSLQTGLATADSIILAPARSEGATLWTQDARFDGMEGVEFRAKRRPNKPKGRPRG